MWHFRNYDRDVTNSDLSLLLIQGIKIIPLKLISAARGRDYWMQRFLPKDNDLTKAKRDALYSLRDGPSIVIKGADKGLLLFSGIENTRSPKRPKCHR